MTVNSAAQSKRTVNRAGMANPITLSQFVEAAAHVKVYSDTTLRSIGTHYTLSGLGTNTLSVTVTATGLALPATTWTVLHDPAMEQAADLSVGGAFGQAYEDAIDALARRVQALAERVSRAVLTAVDKTGAINGDDLVDLLTQVAAMEAAIEAVVDNETNIDTVAAAITAINNVNAALGSIVTANANIAVYTVIAGIATEVNAVGDNIAAVVNAHNNMAAILAAPTQAANAAASAVAAAASATAASLAVSPGGYLIGGKVENNTLFPTDGLIIHPCAATSVAPDRVIMLKAQKWHKRLSFNWAVGDTTGLLDEGAPANGKTYHIHMIQRPDTGVVDYIASLAHDEVYPVVRIGGSLTAQTLRHGYQVDSIVRFTTTGALPSPLQENTDYYVTTSGDVSFAVSATKGGVDIPITTDGTGTHKVYNRPKMPANYTRYRRIWSVKWLAGSVWQFRHVGDTCYHAAGITEYASTTASGAWTAETLDGVPYGLQCEVLLTGSVSLNAGGSYVVGEMSNGDPMNGGVAGDAVLNLFWLPPSSFTYWNNDGLCTSRNATIRYRFTATGATLSANSFFTRGYRDRRGRDNTDF